ncbi:3-oxoacyl-ACP reductase FabG [Nocardia jiangxiensis]|uniref:3-oxoacyl-[acyl-carrier-protein] reductase MabA n=1 Tax=Nocardia jiangxiensis TaxID=282685 RepID=A0ABW6S8A9_9NOCA
MDLGLTGKVAIVTGSARGIGRATARRLGEEGASVVVTDVDADAAGAAVEELADAGLTAIAVAADVTVRAEVEHLVDTAIKRLGGVHVLVNNAGFPRDSVLTKMSDQDWDSVVDVVLKGAFLTSRAVMPHFLDQRWGRVINISSRAYFGNPGQANYSAAKAGVLGLTRALALEEGRFGVTVNAVAPGFVETDAVRSLGHFEKIRERAIAATPLRRTGSPEDIAAAVAFLASECASFVTGETLHVTGGRFG